MDTSQKVLDECKKLKTTNDLISYVLTLNERGIREVENQKEVSEGWVVTFKDVTAQNNQLEASLGQLRKDYIELGDRLDREKLEREMLGRGVLKLISKL